MAEVSEFFRNHTHFFHLATDENGTVITVNELLKKQAILLNNESYSIDRFTDRRGSWIIRAAAQRSKRSDWSIPVVVPRRTHEGTYVLMLCMVSFKEGEYHFIGFDLIGISSADGFSLQRQSLYLKEVAWMISHLIRNHVANIIGLISIVDKQSFNEHNAHIFDMIEKSANWLDFAVHRINSLITQGESGRQK